MTIPPAVLAAWGAESARITPIEIGLINLTFRVDRPEGAIALQRLHPIFAGEVNLDIDAITTQLERAGMITPRPVPTKDGALWIDHDGVWRALTWLEGRVHTELRSAGIARAAGALVGRFHRALEHVEHRFHFTRPGAHDTARHLAKLDAALASESPHVIEARPIAEAILAHARELAPLATTRTRIIHGDLKISNVLFDEPGAEARALLDLDTMAHGIVAHEIGDALRSWCNPGGESAEDARVDPAIFEGALEGWSTSMRGALDDDEIASIVPGFETISLELAMRFATDAIEDRYFGWDRARYASRVEHDRVRARSQLALARSVRSHRSELEAIVARCFR
ncbi:phosphotransferase enzyme family protein [Sandaracinus amylolyticus]|uniref:phosphotransferase enzyme family protein n=1 Tax=Sandaracinus amylolyticus TaxID=927083 RepID=UPI001F1A519A|nr:phosphotransferase [Sandaracinus amylolyticus]UJR80672.1 Aminoglycoside phosphotransferase [Sandaracinus amylolyticus]